MNPGGTFQQPRPPPPGRAGIGWDDARAAAGQPPPPYQPHAPFRPQPPAYQQPQPPAYQQQQPPAYQRPPAMAMQPGGPLVVNGLQPPRAPPPHMQPPHAPPPHGYQSAPCFPQMHMGTAPGHQPPQPSAYQQREIAIASAVAAAAAAAQAKAAEEWDAAQNDAKATARKLADEAADAMDAQVQVCEEADAAQRQARLKLDELERTYQQTHAGMPTLESGKVVRWNTQKGFGFILPRASGGGDLFCHSNDILDGRMLKVGSTVRITRVYDDRKSKYAASEVTGGVPETVPATDDHAEHGAAGDGGQDVDGGRDAMSEALSGKKRPAEAQR